MEKGKVYGFKSVNSRNEFKNEYLCNKEFNAWLGSHFFQVDALDYDGCVTRVVRNDGEYYPSREFQCNIIGKSEYRHFTEISTRPVGWEAGKTYRLEDAVAFAARSNINAAFIRAIGFCTFKVMSVHDGAAGIKTQKLEYVNEHGDKDVIFFTLTGSEFEYFTETDEDVMRGWIRGQALIEGLMNKTMDNSYGDLFIDDEFYHIGQVVKPETNEVFKVKSSGTFEFTVTDEASRLKAISFLQTLEFK
ncbi:hypothetical protein [Yersinia phage MHG19]|nr:hypothetical protein [Yersinia phage MHG19]